MPNFTVTDSETGRVLELTGDSQPTEQEIIDIFSSPQVPQRTDFSQLAESVGPVEAGLISVGRGLTNIGRVVGLSEEEDPETTRAIEALQKSRPLATSIGESIGEAVPFLVPGTAIGAIPALGGRVLAGTALGLTEGGLIAKARDEPVPQEAITGGIIGGGLEAVFPIISRIGGALIRRVTGSTATGSVLDSSGRPTEELNQALEQSGINFEDLTDQATETLRQTIPGSDPQQVARLARLETLGLPATRGDVSQVFEQQAIEARLLESAADPLGDPIRSIRLEQSRAFRSQLESRIQELGVPDNVGESIKEALEERKTLLSSEKTALYKSAIESSERLGSLPIITTNILDAVPKPSVLSRLSRITGNQGDAVSSLLVEFGIDKDPVKVLNFTKSGGEIDILSIGNFEEFRQALNQIERADATRSTSVIIGPVKKALDEEVELFDIGLRVSEVTDDEILKTFKEARATVRQIKTEFSPEAISGKLIRLKRDGVTPLIEASKVFNELVGGQKAPEFVKRTIESLSKSTKGKKAIGDLQAKTVVDLLDHAFKAQTRKVAGERVFGATAFNNRLKQIGDERLNEIFSTRPDILKRIKLVGDVSADITPPSGAVPKGSASVILDSLNKAGVMTILGKIPAGGLLVETIRTVVEKAANRAGLEKALNAKPNVKKMATFIANDAPGFASVLGISFLSKDKENK